MIPERNLNPPEPKVAFTCELCEDDICLGDEYYDIPGLGKCCTNCIDDAHKYDAEPVNIFEEDRYYNEEV